MRKRWGNCSTIFITLVVWDSIKDWPKWLSVKKHEKNCNRWFIFNHWKEKWMLSVSCESFSCQSFACSCSAHIAKVVKVVTVIFVYFLYNIVPFHLQTLPFGENACSYSGWVSEWLSEWYHYIPRLQAQLTHLIESSMTGVHVHIKWYNNVHRIKLQTQALPTRYLKESTAMFLPAHICGVCLILWSFECHKVQCTSRIQQRIGCKQADSAK